MEREHGDEAFKVREFDPSTGAVETKDPMEKKKQAADKTDDWREQK